MFTAAAASPCTVHTRRRATAAGEGVRKAGGQGTRPGTSRAPGHNHLTIIQPLRHKHRSYRIRTYRSYRRKPLRRPAQYTYTKVTRRRATAAGEGGFEGQGARAHGPGTSRAPGHKRTIIQPALRQKHRPSKLFSYYRPYINIILYRLFCIILLGRTVFAGLSTNITNPSRTVSEPGPVTA